MKKFILLLIALILTVFITRSQNLIGYHLNEIPKIMKQLRPDYLIDDSSINDKYPSLKFTDKDEDNTLIYFLDENGYCKYCKLMLASGQAKYVVDTLSRKYKYIDTLTWEDNRSKKPSIIKMKNSDWYFTLIITEK